MLLNLNCSTQGKLNSLRILIQSNFKHLLIFESIKINVNSLTPFNLLLKPNIIEFSIFFILSVSKKKHFGTLKFFFYLYQKKNILEH